MAELFDIVVRRQIYIEGLKAAKGQDFGKMITGLRRELNVRLSQLDFEELGDITKTALRRLIVDLRSIAKTHFDPWLKSLIEWLQRFVQVDRDLLLGVYAKAVPEAATELEDAPEDKDMWAAAIAFPLAATGTLALPFLTALLPSAWVRLERLVMQHYASRSKTNELRRAIVGTEASNFNDGALRLLNAQATAATNTVLQHLANQINQSLGAKIVGFYEWVSILDDKTSAICIERDGNRYAYGRGPIPPAHPNCRSTTCPVKIGSPATPNTFAEWVRAQPFSFINDALDGQRSSRYERTAPIDLDAYSGKETIIGA